MVEPIGSLAWDDGVLKTASPGSSLRRWLRPGDLAEARLGTDPAPARLAPENGGDLLTAAFAVAPFARGPLPRPSFGPAVTPAARAAFELFAGTEERWARADAFCVLRGEPDDFLVCARRAGRIWQVGGFSVKATTLTVRFEDLWDRLPEIAGRRPTRYRMDVLRDPHGKDEAEARAEGVVRGTFAGLAPDVRVCLDLACGGGFMLAFTPEEA